MELLDIRPRDARLPASAFSGGNQQKIILAKWLAREVGVLLLEEPTQGVDVAAKAQIHRLIRAFAERGGGVLLRSSDFAELTLGLRRHPGGASRAHHRPPGARGRFRREAIARRNRRMT
jgi:ABC-type sugar transport system ATPase subunit